MKSKRRSKISANKTLHKLTRKDLKRMDLLIRKALQEELTCKHKQELSFLGECCKRYNDNGK